MATSATELAWLHAVRDRSSREIENLVNGRRPGDLPDDPPDPEAMMHTVRFDIAAHAYASYRETRLVLDEEHGTRLDDTQVPGSGTSPISNQGLKAEIARVRQARWALRSGADPLPRCAAAVHKSTATAERSRRWSFLDPERLRSQTKGLKAEIVGARRARWALWSGADSLPLRSARCPGRDPYSQRMLATRLGGSVPDDAEQDLVPAALLLDGGQRQLGRDRIDAAHRGVGVGAR